jgi:RNA polymerase sigma-70 factor (ECF subfamily)
MHELTDHKENSLIRGLQSGSDTEAFGLLIEKYQDMVYNYCYRFFGDPDDAFDISQDIFLKVLTQIQSFQFKSKFSTWLYRIMMNTCNNVVRSNAYKKRASGLTLVNGIKSKTGMNEGDPEKELLNKELREIMFTAINGLKPKARHVLILRDIECRSYEEISKIMNLKIGTVRSTLSRARLKVAQEIKTY